MERRAGRERQDMFAIFKKRLTLIAEYSESQESFLNSARMSRRSISDLETIIRFRETHQFQHPVKKCKRPLRLIIVYKTTLIMAQNYSNRVTPSLIFHQTPSFIYSRTFSAIALLNAEKQR